jgi:formylglycine-generating enzyme required for sulfatase activity
MLVQSMLPDEGLVLFQDDRRVISMHAGSSPRAADFAFASTAHDVSVDRVAPGQLSRYALHALGASYLELPTPDTLSNGFHVCETPSGVRLVFVVTIKYRTDAATLLRTNLHKAMSALGRELASKIVWLPLMGTGAAGLSMQASLDITLGVLGEAALGIPGRPAHVRVDLPLDLPPSFREQLFQRARMRSQQASSSPPVVLPPAMGSPAPPRRGRNTNPPPPRDSGPSNEQALVALLADLFSDSELRRWVRLELGHEVDGALPGSSVALDELCFQLVRQAGQRGLASEGFFAKLIDARPQRAERIREVAALWRDEQRAQRSNTGTENITPSGRSRGRPSDPDFRLLSTQLAAAYTRKHALEDAGASTADVEQEILRLKRDIRSGGQLRTGDQLGEGRYLLLERIGRGGFAHVWKALDQESRELVAVKVLHSELAGDVIRRDRFARGARIMAELGGHGVVRILQPHDEDDGYHYFVMELLPGGDLRRAVLDGRVGARDVVPLLGRVGETLARAHARNFVHRDVKPANILLTENGEPRLTDFDLVSAKDSTGGTRTGALGTFVYAAIEMMDRPQDADARADVYGLGMTAVFMLHGAELPHAEMHDAVGFLAKLPCDEWLKRLLQRAVARKAEDRFTDAAAFCQALRERMQAAPRIESVSPAPPTDTGELAESFVEPKTGIRFLLVPGGRFTMGANILLPECLPLHLVEISPFWLAETPVTRAQYERFLIATHRDNPKLWNEARFSDPNQPVVSVSWWDAHVFCQWASRISGLAMTLPSEAQWEFAARGEEGRPYPWGSDEPDELRAQFSLHVLHGSPLPVGNLPGSRGPFGHLDQAGNVWEWCLDTWDSSAYARRGELTQDPVVLRGGVAAMRVVRGGAFISMPSELHAAYRMSWSLGVGTQGIGFRVAVLPHSPGETPDVAEPQHESGG